MSDILNLIDNALEDYPTSGDAMRWTTEPPLKPRGNRVSDIVYVLPSVGYPEWTAEQREAVEGFLRDHDLDPTHVPIANGNEIVVRMLPDASMELQVWVHDLDNGRIVMCPHCPGCAKQRQVKVPLRTAVPAHPDAFIAEHVAVGRDGDS